MSAPFIHFDFIWMRGAQHLISWRKMSKKKHRDAYKASRCFLMSYSHSRSQTDMQIRGFSRALCFLINALDDGTFQDIFQFGIIPFPFIEEMCNCGTVAWAVFFKVNRFPMISKRKNGYQYSHDMLHGGLWKDTA